MRHRLTLEERVGIAADLAVRAGAYHGLWYATASAEYRAKYRCGLEEHWDALRFYQAGQMFALVSTLHSLFETRKDTINLVRLSAELGGMASDESDAARPLALKVLHLRHNLFAHRSANLGVEDVYKLASITSNDLRDLAALALSIVTKFCGHLGLPHPPEPIGAVAAANNLLSALQRDELRTLAGDGPPFS